MKRFSLLLLLCLTFAFATAQTTSSTSDKLYALKLKELLIKTHAFDASKNIMAAQYKAMKGQLGLSDRQCDILADEVVEILYNHTEDIFLPVYKKVFTYEELLQLIEFYNTPLGKKMADNTVFLTNESMAQVEKIMPTLTDEILVAVEKAKTK